MAKDKSDDFLLEAEAAVPLKEAITLADLRNKEGFNFSIDDQSPLLDCNEDDDDNTYFKNFECGLLQGDDTDDDEDEALSFFQRCCKNMVNLTDDGGVKKKVKRSGVGSVVGDRGRVRVHYSAFLDGVDETFDSTRMRAKPLSINLGQGQLIGGLELAIASMKKDEISRVLVTCDYAYGKLGCPPRIPAEATILYEVELLGFEPESALGNYEDLSEQDRSALPFSKIRNIGVELNSEGNLLFTQGSYIQAVKKYVRAVKVVENARFKNQEQEEDLYDNVLFKAYHNMAQSYLKVGRYGKAIWCSKKVLERKPDHVKSLYICGKSMRHCADFKQARSYLMRAHKLAPNSKDIMNEMKRLGEREQECREAEELMCERMFRMKSK